MLIAPMLIAPKLIAPKLIAPCLGTVLAAIVATLTPGPGMLALFATVARGGRREGLRFLGGEIGGDVAWSALAAILGVSSIGPHVFAGIGVFCGLYLLVLGWRTFARAGGNVGPVPRSAALRSGVVLGLTNPKSYPVYIALFGAVLGRYGARLDWSVLPALLLSATFGFVVGDGFLVVIAGLPWVRARFLRHRRLLGRDIGVVFIAFGVKLTADSLGALAAPRP